MGRLDLRAIRGLAAVRMNERLRGESGIGPLQRAIPPTVAGEEARTSVSAQLARLGQRQGPILGEGPGGLERLKVILAILVCSLATVVVTPMLLGNRSHALAAIVASVAICLLHPLAAVSLFSRSRVEILRPVIWFLFTTAAYFGLGPLIYFFGNSESIEYCDAFYPVDDAAAWRVACLNLGGIVVALGAYILTRETLGRRGWGGRAWLAPRSSRFWLPLFLAVGLPVKYLISLPRSLGLLQSAPPSSVMVFEVMVFCALVLLARRAAVEGGRIWLFVAVIALPDLASAALNFSKQELLWALLPIPLGLFWSTGRLKVIGMAGVVAVAVYWLALPFVTFGRARTTTDWSVSARSDAVQQYVGEGRHSSSQDDTMQRWWIRLNYSPVQAFVIDMYDAGSRGSSLDGLLVSLVPRFLWPDKPTVTIGDQLTELVNGSSTSMSSPTTFGEGYWNGGIFGLCLAASFMGMVLAGYEIATMRHLNAGNIGILPVTVLGLRTALRPDDWFGPTFVGSAAIAVFLYAILTILSRVGYSEGEGGATALPESLRIGRQGRREPALEEGVVR